MAYTTINKSTDYFNTKLYTGNGSNNHTITGVGFDTDLAWIKNRGGDDHRLFDKVRGVNKYIKSNTTGAEVTDAIFTTNSDGYVVTDAGEVNANNGNFVAWNWKANGAGSSNTDGSISSTVSVNSTSGFSIVKYTGNQTSGATVGHGLGSVPKMIMIKNLNDAESWVVHVGALNDPEKVLFLNGTDAETNSSTSFNTTTPTSSVFTLGNSDRVNNVNIPYIAYCFANVTGYSKCGSYVGNGNADGTFVYTGFKPAWLLIKKSSASGNGWFLMDTKTNTYNSKSIFFQANLSNAETDVDRMDILSNGFKARYDWSIINESGATYTYMCFAEAPLVGTNNVPCTAR